MHPGTKKIKKDLPYKVSGGKVYPDNQSPSSPLDYKEVWGFRVDDVEEGYI